MESRDWIEIMLPTNGISNICTPKPQNPIEFGLKLFNFKICFSFAAPLRYDPALHWQIFELNGV